MTAKDNPSAIPLPLLFAKPTKDQVRLSPLGTWLAYRSRDSHTGVLNLWIQNVKTGKERQLTFEKAWDVCLLYWFTYDDKSIVYLREPKMGSEMYHLYAIDLLKQGSNSNKIEPRDLIQDRSTTCAMGFAGGLQVWLDSKQPRVVYTSTAPCGLRSVFWNVSRLHIDSGESTIVAHNPLSNWTGLGMFVVCSLFSAALRLLGLSDAKRQPRATVQWFPDQHMNFRGRLDVSLLDLSCAWKVQDATNAKMWKVLHYVTWANANMSLVGSTGGSGTAHFDFSQDGSTVDLHICDKTDTTSYERYQIESGEHIEHLTSHPKSDITGFLKSPKTKAVEGVVYNYEKPTLQCLKDCPGDVRKDITFLQKEFSNASISIVSRSLDDQTWVVHVQSDVGLKLCLNSPSGYFVVYRHSEEDGRQPSFEFFLSPQPDLAKYSLGTMTPVHVPARDGEDLLCYLSRPPSGQKSPMVVLIHGGPQARDVWQFHPLCQLLCLRGVSVLQVNYRGSAGMGTRFIKLGLNGALAAGVQDDVQDAASHAIAKGWCFPDKIAIMGGSFGGYSTLAAMTHRQQQEKDQQEPDYKCAIALCPPSIVGAANLHKAFYGNPLVAKYWRIVYGEDISTKVEASQAVSPLFHVDKIRRPLLLLHGEDDPRVPIAQTNDLCAKLQQQQQTSECEHMRFAGEGHGIRKEQNILCTHHRVERFLCRHLGLPDPPVLEGSWIKGHTGTIVSKGTGSSEKDRQV